MIAELSPGLVLILGAVLVPLLPGHLRSAWAIALPILALLHLAGLPGGERGEVELMGITLTTLRVDELSRIFGFAFLVAILIGLIYALPQRNPLEQTAALIHAGGAIGAVFAGDLVTLFFFWTGTAVASVFLIWAAGGERAYRAGMRYLILQILSVLLLFEGALHFHHDYGTIAFGALSLGSMGGWMVLGSFAILAAFPLVHMWLPDAYCEATPAGAVILSALSTKLAVYALARGFAGAELLIAIGVVMAIAPLVLAALAADLRRLLAYVLIGQVGIMVAGVGVGSELALNGVAALAFAHILSMLLLFMAAGALMSAAGTASRSSLSGLHRAMPWTAGFAAAGVLSMAAPLFAGYLGHSMIFAAAGLEGHDWAALALAGGMAAAFALVGLRMVEAFALGVGEAAGTGEAPASMLVAMGLAAALSLAAGMFPGWVIAMLPYPATLDPYSPGQLVGQLQLLAFAGLAVALLARFGLMPRPRAGRVLDLDWIYRRPGRAAARAVLEGARASRSRLLALAWQGWSGLFDRIYHYMGPRGILARNWPTGAMAFWTTVLLAVWLLAYYV